jgi:hypothetical protein
MTGHIETPYSETPVSQSLGASPVDILESYRLWTKDFLEPYAAINAQLGLAGDTFEVHFRDPFRKDTIVVGQDLISIDQTAFSLEYSNEEAYEQYLEQEREARIKRLAAPQHPLEVPNSVIQAVLYDKDTIALSDRQLRDTYAAVSQVYSKLKKGLGRSAVGHMIVQGYPITIAYSTKTKNNVRA